MRCSAVEVALISHESADDTANQMVAHPIEKVVLGKKHMSSSENPSPYGQWPNGRFVYLPSSGDVFLVTETFSAVTDKSSDWLNKDFIQAGTLKSLSSMNKPSPTTKHFPP